MIEFESDELFEEEEPHFRIKVGRNEPCPCGSEKKYKKCCGAQGLTLEQILSAKLSESAQTENLEAVSTIQILKALSDVGVKSVSRDSFGQLATSLHSTIKVAQAWSQEVGKSLSPEDQLFLEEAADSLWKRWFPNRGSTERIIELLDNGYDLLEDNNEAQAIEFLWKAWTLLRGQFTPEMKTIDDTEMIFEDSEYFISDLIMDLEMALSGNILESERFQDIAIQFCEQILTQFSTDPSENLEHIRLKLAEAYGFQGKQLIAEEVYRKMIQEKPHRSAGYVGWADSLRSKDRAKAKMILEQALQAPVEDADDWDIPYIIKRLIEES